MATRPREVADPEHAVAIERQRGAELVGELAAIGIPVEPLAVEPHDLGKAHAQQHAVGRLDQLAQALGGHALLGAVVDDAAAAEGRDDAAADGPDGAVAPTRTGR